jgi:hypothetical protein
VCNKPDKTCVRCKGGCYCKNGFVRKTEKGRCIKAIACEKAFAPITRF